MRELYTITCDLHINVKIMIYIKHEYGLQVTGQNKFKSNTNQNYQDVYNAELEN